MKRYLLVMVVLLGACDRQPPKGCSDTDVARMIITMERPTMGPLEQQFWLEAIRKAASSQNLSVTIVTSKIAQETKFRPGLTSNKGARGPAQIMPMWLTSDLPECKGIDPFEIEPALACGSRILSEELKFSKGDIKLALQYYNGGRTSGNNFDTKVYANEVLARVYLAGAKCQPTR